MCEQCIYSQFLKLSQSYNSLNKATSFWEVEPSKFISFSRSPCQHKQKSIKKKKNSPKYIFTKTLSVLYAEVRFESEHRWIHLGINLKLAVRAEDQC